VQHFGSERGDRLTFVIAISEPESQGAAYGSLAQFALLSAPGMVSVLLISGHASVQGTQSLDQI
jgi:hypothetical protein